MLNYYNQSNSVLCFVQLVQLCIELLWLSTDFINYTQVNAELHRPYYLKIEFVWSIMLNAELNFFNDVYRYFGGTDYQQGYL